MSLAPLSNRAAFSASRRAMISGWGRGDPRARQTRHIRSLLRKAFFREQMMHSSAKKTTKAAKKNKELPAM